MRSRTLPLLAAALTLVACSHGGTTAADIARVPEVPLAQLVDPQANGAVHLDLATIASSPYYATVTDWIDLAMEDTDEGPRAFIRTVLRGREAVMFISMDGETPRTALLLRGHYTMQDAMTLYRTDLPGSERQHGPYTVHDQGEHGAVVLFGAHTLVLGDRQLVDRIIDRQIGGGGGGYPSNSAFTTLASRVGFLENPVGFVVVPTDAMRAGAGEDDPFLATLSQAQALAVSVDVRQGLRAKGVIDLDSALMAMGLVTLGRGRLSAMASETDVEETGLGPLLNRIELDREGSSVVVNLAAPEAEARQSFSAFSEFLHRANP